MGLLYCYSLYHCFHSQKNVIFVVQKELATDRHDLLKICVVASEKAIK